MFEFFQMIKPFYSLKVVSAAEFLTSPLYPWKLIFQLTSFIEGEFETGFTDAEDIYGVALSGDGSVCMTIGGRRGEHRIASWDLTYNPPEMICLWEPKKPRKETDLATAITAAHHGNYFAVGFNGHITLFHTFDVNTSNYQISVSDFFE